MPAFTLIGRHIAASRADEPVDIVAGGRPHIRLRAATILVAVAAAALVMPSLQRIAVTLWNTEEGGHGPVLIAICLWLGIRIARQASAPDRPAGLSGAIVLGVSLIGHIIARRTHMLGPAWLGLFGALVGILALLSGWRLVRRLWFPLALSLVALPLPETIILPLGRALRLGISGTAASLLAGLGYSVSHSGVVIFVDQYDLLMENACSGLNSLIGLSAVGSFYAYTVHNGRVPWRFLLMIPAVAIGVNFLRVVLLILATHALGASLVTAYVHDVAAVAMYGAALGALIGLDVGVTHFARRRAGT